MARRRRTGVDVRVCVAVTVGVGVDGLMNAGWWCLGGDIFEEIREEYSRRVRGGCSTSLETVKQF